MPLLISTISRILLIIFLIILHIPKTRARLGAGASKILLLIWLPSPFLIWMIFIFKMVLLLELIVDIRKALIVHTQIKLVALLREGEPMRRYLQFVIKKPSQRFLLVYCTIVSKQPLFTGDY